MTTVSGRGGGGIEHMAGVSDAYRIHFRPISRSVNVTLLVLAGSLKSTPVPSVKMTRAVGIGVLSEWLQAAA